jgi:hypothetical protein
MCVQRGLAWCILLVLLSITNGQIPSRGCDDRCHCHDANGKFWDLSALRYFPPTDVCMVTGRFSQPLSAVTRMKLQQPIRHHRIRTRTSFQYVQIFTAVRPPNYIGQSNASANITDGMRVCARPTEDIPTVCSNTGISSASAVRYDTGPTGVCDQVGPDMSAGVPSTHYKLDKVGALGACFAANMRLTQIVPQRMV